MSTEQPTSRPAAPEKPEKIAPHPTLSQYYGSPEQRQPYIDRLFDETAQHYDWICRVMSFGSGEMYRRQALERAGARPGMRVLDVATGTGGVARGAVTVTGEKGLVVGLDPSRGMLEQCRRNGVASPLVEGRGEILPFAERQFDLVSMGYALRHVPDLSLAFQEYLRVLKPGGRVLILEITRPRSALGRALLALYMRVAVPLVTRIGTGSAQAQRLMRYYWDTISQCVAPEVILQALRGAGFQDVSRSVMGGILSEYNGRRPS